MRRCWVSASSSSGRRRSGSFPSSTAATSSSWCSCRRARRWRARTRCRTARAVQTKGLGQVFTLFEVSTPQIYLDIDRTKAQLLGINIPDVFNALQTYLGSAYVNDFNILGRTFRVIAQSDAEHRLNADDV